LGAIEDVVGKVTRGEAVNIPPEAFKQLIMEIVTKVYNNFFMVGYTWI
jgi:hypothetical protein